MHLQFLIEDMSGEVLIKHVMNKLVLNRQSVTYDCKAFKGIGGFKKCTSKSGVKTNKLLNDLGIYLKGFDKSFRYIDAAVIIVLDNDSRNADEFRKELNKRALRTRVSVDYVFCIAVEEMEAWLLGDRQALLKAYPNARESVLKEYHQDSICGTWEVLANAIYKGGLKRFLKDCPSYREIGKYKSKWADDIGRHMDINNNASPSFNEFIYEIQKRKNTVCQSIEET